MSCFEVQILIDPIQYFLCRAAWERIQFVDTIYAIGEARIIYRWFGMTMD